jgi:hypothetical protein
MPSITKTKLKLVTRKICYATRENTFKFRCASLVSCKHVHTSTNAYRFTKIS